MCERAFVDREPQPTDASLASSLGAAWEFHDRLLSLATGYSHEWRFTRGTGWTLKVFDRRKALLYLIPLRDAIRVSLTVRASERDALLADPDLAPLHDALAAARRLPEGYALQHLVRNEDDYRPLERFLAGLVALRA